MIDVIELESCESTNTYLSGVACGLTRDTVVTAREQTAGRGQRGNSWEASPGLNLTCSLLLMNRKGIKAAGQFAISEAVALGIVDTVRHFLGEDFEVKVKWPNDIYVGDRKICGIFIEHSISNREVAVDEVLRLAVDSIYRRLDGSLEELHRDYNRELWRKDGNRYMDAMTGDKFQAVISEVMTDGTLCLVDDEGAERRYLFKEVAVARD